VSDTPEPETDATSVEDVITDDERRRLDEARKDAQEDNDDGAQEP
jgi:hypothetical protein